MHEPIPQAFFDRSAPEIAQDLLGKFLIRKHNDHPWALMITEVEAFDGPHDKASRAHHHGRTKETEAMFLRGGAIHIECHQQQETLEDFFAAGDADEREVVPCTPLPCYALHIVTGPIDYPATVLIRSALIMLPTGEIEHIEGPTNLTRFLHIGSEFDGKPMGTECALWIEDRDIDIPADHIQKRKRVGTDYALDQDEALYNFSIAIVRNKDLSS